MLRAGQATAGPISPVPVVHPGTPVGACCSVGAQSTVAVPCLLRPGFQGRLNITWKPPCSPAPDSQPEEEKGACSGAERITE